jgi:serralysin
LRAIRFIPNQKFWRISEKNWLDFRIKDRRQKKGETIMANITGNNNPNNLMGTSGNDTISGLGGNDTLDGKAGNDKLYGGSDNDILKGQDGNDTLDGGTGNDLMQGGAGNDVYIVDSIWDNPQELAFGGTDTVRSSVDWDLGSDFNHLVLTGTAYYGGGNNLHNQLTGNASSNDLWGGDGNDTLNGQGGTDYLYGSTGNDLISGGDGIDELWGDDGNDRLLGGNGNDFLQGNSGYDTLTGNAGAEQFVFYQLSDAVDTITDFKWVEGDKLCIYASGFGATSIDEFTDGYNSSTLTDSLYFNGNLVANLTNLSSDGAFIPSADIHLIF